MADPTLSQIVAPQAQQTQAPPADISVQLQAPDAASQEEPLNLDEGTISPPISPATMEDRSSKFKYGLGDLLLKTKDDIYNDLQNGNEADLRSSAASTIDLRKQQATQQLLTTIMSRKGGELTPEEHDGVVEMVNNLQKTTDPNTVFETAYGRQFINTLDTVNQDKESNVLKDARQIDPEGVAQTLEDHSTLVAKREIINTKLQNAQDEIKAQGWIGYGYDQVKQMIPGYPEYQMRGLNPAVGQLEGGADTAENLDKQRIALLRLPPDEMAAKLDTIVEPLMKHNPSLAVQYLQAMQGLSTEDRFLMNMGLPMSLLGIDTGAAGAKITKGILREGAETLPKEAAQKVLDVRKAAGDMARAAMDPGVSKSTMEAAAGDLLESAVTRVTTDNISATQNVLPATQKAIEALSSTTRLDGEAVKANPGRFGQDIVNRIAERDDQMMGNAIDLAENFQKVERLPEVLANESAVRVIIEDMKDKYRDLKNSIIDTSKIYPEPVSNTKLIDFYIGNPDGSYISQRSVAENRIKFLGLGDAEIGEGKNPEFGATAVRDAKLTQQIKTAQEIIDRETERMKGPQTDAQKAYSQGQITSSEEYLVDKHMERIAFRKQTADVQQQGLGYYIKVTKPIDETRPAIRQAIAKTANTKIPDSPVTKFVNSFLGKVRTPEEVLSEAERANRLIATYGPGEFFHKIDFKEIKSLSAGRFSKGRKRWEEWQQGLENAQELPDAMDPDRKGYFFQSPGEMEHHWQQWFHRLPDEQEIAAYFEFKRGMEIDRVYRNIAVHRNLQRIGSETHNILLTDAAGKPVRSPDFAGIRRNTLPGADENLVIFKDHPGDETMLDLSRQPVKRKKEIQEDIDRGLYKLVEITNPEQRPLTGFGSIADERIRYALVPNLETRALDWNHIPRRGGGHIQYDYDFYIKQARVVADTVGNRHWYEGDTTVMAAPTNGIGHGVATHLNEVRKLLKVKNEGAARNYAEKNLHVDWDELKSWFVGAKDAEGKYQPPHLSLNEEIKVVPKNKQVIDIDNDLAQRYENFRNGTREGSAGLQAQVEYARQRDAFELKGVNVEGTKANPLYKISPADKVDAVTTMNRGMQRIVRSNFLDDYKTMAVEHWLAQAQDHLKVDNDDINRIWNSPYYYFNQGEFKNAVPADTKALLEAARYHTLQLTGQPSLTDGLMYSIAQKLHDLSFEKLGPKGLVLTPTKTLPYLRDPIKFARSIAFDMKLGMFNLPQFIVQAGNYANIFGIAGHKYATPGTFAAQLHFWSTVNAHPSILEHLDGIASKLYIPGASQWKIGEFKEGFEELFKTGFARAGGEQAVLDTLDQKAIKTGFGTIMDWGRFPFKQGEQNARYGAWYTAFKEFRDANPFGAITNDDRAKILQRADLLNINMSRASSSAIHKGIWSIPTQFYTYQIRSMELMFGTRLTKTERFRMFATNAALYGLPIGISTTTGLPIADYLRQKALENNYVVGDDYLKSMLMEGLPSAIGAVIEGQGDPKAGTYYDIGPRFGGKGLEFLGNASAGNPDKGWLDTIGGPVYSIAKDTISGSQGLARAMISMMRQDDEVFPLTVDDVADAFKTISSVSSGMRVLAATNFGRYVSKKDSYLADSSPAQAIFGALTGVKDVAIDDINVKTASLKQQTDYEHAVEKEFRKYFTRGMLAQKDNPEQAKRYFTQASAMLAIGGYREDRISGLISKALEDNTSVMDKTNFDFYIRKAPDSNVDAAASAYSKTMNIQDQKQGTQK